MHRLVPSHFPPISLCETVADAADLEVIYEIESLTNDRLLDDIGDLFLVPRNERVSGPGSTPVMAAFTHIGIANRFTDGSFGVYYGVKDIDTAIAETIYHREHFLAATQEPDTEITMRQYVGTVTLPMHDIRTDDYKHLHQPEDYSASQAFASLMRNSGSNGLIYNSVRNPTGECVAAFKPKAVSLPVQGAHYRYVWNGYHQKITGYFKVTEC